MRELILTHEANLRTRYGGGGCTAVLDAIHVFASAVRDGGSEPIVSRLSGAVSDETPARAARERDADLVLIVGGQDILPSFVIDDPPAGQRVYSDCAELVWERERWPGPCPGVGRMPGEDSRDPRLILAQLSRAAAARRAGGVSLQTAFAFSSEYCMAASAQVFGPWANPASHLFTCPPLSLCWNHQPAAVPHTWRNALVYVALHGEPDVDFWYGEPAAGFPPSDTPQNYVFLDAAHARQIDAEQSVICSSGCCGAFVRGKTADDSPCLGFLSQGACAFIGATGRTWELVQPESTRLAMVDILYAHVMARIAAGSCFGRALVEARECYRPRTHYDRINAYSLVLFGDPGLRRAPL